MTLDDDDLNLMYEDGLDGVSRADFIQYALDYKLLDANEANYRRRKKGKKELKRKSSVYVEEEGSSSRVGSLLCCIRFNDRNRREKKNLTPAREVQAASKEMVEEAFRKFDKNGDGVIDWEEFQQVLTHMHSLYIYINLIKVSTTVDQEQLRRIFEACDQVT